MLARANQHQFFNLEGTPYVEEKKIGRGAFGVVCKAKQTKTGECVAIKKISCAYMAATLARGSLREEQRDIYIVMNLMQTDLHQIIHSKQTLHEQHHEYFLYQILRGLKIADFGMARSVEQCNGSGNILTEQCNGRGNILTMYVATRWYRAPEVLFSTSHYDTKNVQPP